MAWTTSDRRAFLPPDWRKRRARRLRADEYTCTATTRDGDQCDAEATEVDHIGKRDDHRHHMLRSLCHEHHAIKTAAQASAARSANRRRVNNSFRRTEAHPASMR